MAASGAVAIFNSVGDVTGNGAVSAYDAAYVLEYVVSVPIPPPRVTTQPWARLA
jgi:hypothetical protein